MKHTNKMQNKKEEAANVMYTYLQNLISELNVTGNVEVINRMRINIVSLLTADPLLKAMETYSAASKDLTDEINTESVPKTGIQLIKEERIEQQTKHGTSIENDYYGNDEGDLCVAAVALVTHDYKSFVETWSIGKCSKMMNKPFKQRLVIAGALIAAEIDRHTFGVELSKANKQKDKGELIPLCRYCLGDKCKACNYTGYKN